MSVIRRIGATMFGCAVALLIAGPVAAQEAASLKAAFFTGNPESPFLEAFKSFVDRVNEEGEGTIQITDVLGPDAVPSGQQGNALQSGLVDIIGVPPSYLESLQPGLGGLSAARISTSEMREKGVFETVNELLVESANARMIGLFAGDIPFYIFTNKEVRSLDDFEGLRLRTTNTVKAFFEALGAQPMQIGRGEIYTALERGVADGYSNINSELWSSSWIEVVNYRVGPGFYAPNIGIFINQDTWEGLSEAQQEILHEAAVLSEGEPTQAMVTAEKDAIDRAVADGRIEVIEFSEEEGEKFLDMAYSSQWEVISAQAPEFAEKLRDVLAGE